jgi:pimeloyl-ACP methyl ester carboxylesterase
MIDSRRVRPIAGNRLLSAIAALLAALLLFACGAERLDTARVTPSSTEWYFWTDDDVRHYVAEIGNGPTVVVLHGGWGAEHSYLLDVVRPLEDRFRFVLYDQRGSLRSPAPDATISLGRLVQDLEKLRREIRVDRMTLLTHSMGSQLACAYLRAHPARVNAMVMMNAVIPQDAEIDDELATQAHQRFIEFAQANEARQVRREGLEGRDWRDLSDKEKSARNQISHASGNIYHIDRWRQLKGGQAFYNGRVCPLLRDNTAPDAWQGLFGALQSFGGPIRLILGDHDLGDFGVELWPGLVATFPDVELTVIDDAGHNAWIDQPGKVRDALAEALSGVVR